MRVLARFFWQRILFLDASCSALKKVREILTMSQFTILSLAFDHLEIEEVLYRLEGSLFHVFVNAVSTAVPRPTEL
jgi:hypothetical protein